MRRRIVQYTATTVTCMHEFILHSRSSICRYQYVTVDELNKLRLTRDIVCEGLERDPSGQLISVAVSARSLLLADRGVTRLMVGPPSLLESLNGYSGIDVTSVWVSMQSKEQFVKQAATMVARGEGNAGTGAELVPHCTCLVYYRSDNVTYCIPHLMI